MRRVAAVVAAAMVGEWSREWSQVRDINGFIRGKVGR